MSDEAGRTEVDRRLAAGFVERGLVDNVDAYRDRLRELKGTDRDAFQRAVAYYDAVRSRIEGGEDPIDTWIEYGGMLGSLTDTGELMSIDSTGRARTYSAPAQPDQLILFVPETGRAAFVVARPLQLSAAQSATIDLLVDNRLALR